MTYHGKVKILLFRKLLILNLKVLCENTNLELNNGNRYGLLGANGCGKSTLLKALADQDIQLQKHIDIFYLSREMAASDKVILAKITTEK